MLCAALVCFVFILFPPPSSLSLDPNAVPGTAAAPETEDTIYDLALAAEQPGKHPLFEHTDIAYSFSLMLALELLLLLLHLL